MFTNKHDDNIWMFLFETQFLRGAYLLDKTQSALSAAG